VRGVREERFRFAEGEPISSAARSHETEPGEPEGTPVGGVRRRPPWAPGDPEAEGGSFGAWLRRQREMREIHLHEIADRTKISLRYLQAMEQDRFELLPAPVFARGFLREYAKYVGLSPDEVVNYYLSAIGAAAEGDDDAAEAPAIRRRGAAASPWSYGVFLVLGFVLLVAVVAFLAFYAENRRREARPARTNAAPPAARVLEAAPPPPPAAAADPAAPLIVTLDFTQECWVELVVDDRRRMSELHAPGESLQIEAERSVLLANVGNAQGVEVQVNGEPYSLPSDGRVVRDVRIELPPPVEADGRGGAPEEPGPSAAAAGAAAASP
jgi:cytoskeletal protein RodZ